MPSEEDKIEGFPRFFKTGNVTGIANRKNAVFCRKLKELSVFPLMPWNVEKDVNVQGLHA
jgi:hypothetical protein